MAGVEDNKVVVQLIHGSKKFEVELSEDGEELTVGHLAQQVAQQAGVPQEKQKLICKGKSLSDPEKSLKSLGIKNGSKIMLIGKKFSEEDDRLLKVIGKIEETSSKSQDRVADIASELEGIRKGYLDSAKSLEAVKKASKRLAATGEELAKQLEQLDALALQDAAADVRQKRKALVDRINKSLDMCEKKGEESRTMLENMKS